MDDQGNEMRTDRCHVLDVIDDDGQLLGRCGCGWTAPPAADGRQIGEAWTAHRNQADAVTRVA